MKIYDLINFGAKTLKNKGILSNRLDSEILLSYAMGISREKLLINEKNVGSDEINKFKTFILRRSKKEPVAYITNIKEFRSKNYRWGRKQKTRSYFRGYQY